MVFLSCKRSIYTLKSDQLIRLWWANIELEYLLITFIQFNSKFKATYKNRDECDQKVGNIWWKNSIYLNLNKKWFEMWRKDYILIIFIIFFWNVTICLFSVSLKSSALFLVWGKDNTFHYFESTPNRKGPYATAHSWLQINSTTYT